MPSAETPLPIELPTNGIRKDIPPIAVGFQGLIEAENWIYRDAQFRVRPGLTSFSDDIDQRPLGFIQYDHGAEDDRLVMGTDDSWFHYNSGAGTWTDLDGAANPLTGGAIAQVVFRTFESGGTVKLIGVNGNDEPKVWPGTGSYADLAGTPPTAAVALAVAADRVLMAQGDTFYWSGNLDETDWTATGVRVADTPGDIISLLEFGNMRTAIYKESSLYMAFAQTDLLYKFRIELVRSGIPGPVSPNAVFPLGELGIHCYLAESGAVMLFDGNAPSSIGDHVQTHIRATRDYDLRQRSFGFYDPLQNDIYIFYANSGAVDVNSCVIINYDTRAMHYYTFPNHAISAGYAGVITDSTLVSELPVIDTIAQTFGEMDRGQTGIIFGEESGQVYHHIGTTDDYVTNLSSAKYQWTSLGGFDSDIYVLQLSGGAEAHIPEPDVLMMDGVVLNKTGFPLSDHEWMYGDHSGIGVWDDNLFLRDDSGDPDVTGVVITMVEKHSIANFFETGLQMLGEPRRFGVLQSAEHLFLTSTAAQDISIAIGKSDYGETRELQAAQDVAIGAGGPYETQHRLPGRLFSLRMSSLSNVSVEWLGSLAAYTATGLR
jgi:hypothetical protein